MPDVVLVDRAQAIVDNVVSTLQAAMADGANVFASVRVFDDIGTFGRVAEALKETACGIVARQPERGDGQDNGEEFIERLPMDICVRFYVRRVAGGQELDAVKETQRLAEVIRAALLADRFRAGHSNTIVWSGKLIRGTDVTGSPRTLAGKPGDGIHTFVIPVVCGWSA